jgi:hypothetical protein
VVVTVLVVMWVGGGGVRRWWWLVAAVVVAAVVVAAVLVVVVGGGGGARAAGRWAAALELLFCFMKISFAESFPTLGTPVTRGSDVALGKEAFAGPAVPRALCREFHLGTGCAERDWAFAKSIALSAKS